MKAIQITMDEQLLARLDREEDVKREGRSAVLRRAVDEYLKRKRDQRIAAQYRKAYAKSSATTPESWEGEEVWLDE